MAYKSKHTGAEIESILDNSIQATANANSAASNASAKATLAESKAELAQSAADNAEQVAEDAKAATQNAVQATANANDAISGVNSSKQAAENATEQAQNVVARCELAILETERASNTALSKASKAEDAADRVSDLIDGKKTEFWKLTKADATFGVTIGKAKVFSKGKYLYRSTITNPSGYDTETLTYTVAGETTTKRIYDGDYITIDSGQSVIVNISINNMSNYDTFVFYKAEDGFEDRFDAKLTGFASKEELEGKVDKVEGKNLSTNDYTDDDKSKVAAAITQHQDISGKVDKVVGKGLSTNDYTDADKAEVAKVSQVGADMGNVASLTTNAKTVVPAINELVKDLADVVHYTDAGSVTPEPTITHVDMADKDGLGNVINTTYMKVADYETKSMVVTYDNGDTDTFNVVVLK